MGEPPIKFPSRGPIEMEDNEEQQQQQPTPRQISIQEPMKEAKETVDFQAVFPGWPANYFKGILPSPGLGASYETDLPPNFNYTEDETMILPCPQPNSLYTPTTPDPMYVKCMPWSAYPYGIPTKAVIRKSEALKTEGTLLAVPSPKLPVKKTILDFWVE